MTDEMTGDDQRDGDDHDDDDDAGGDDGDDTHVFVNTMCRTMI
jgi:hypothetical protein